jgi:hypothetical protein
VDRVAGPLVVQVALEHGCQPALTAKSWFQGGQGSVLPDGAGLAGGRPGADDGQQAVDLLGRHPRLLQRLAGGWQQPLHQLGRGDRPHAAARP